MVIQSLSLEQAVEMTVVTVRLWDVQNAQPQAGYFRLTQPQFQNWKVTNRLYNIIGEDILQTPDGLLSYTKTWQERIPTTMRFGRKVEDAITDAAGAHGYPNNIRGIWYKHVNQEVIPANDADQEWQNTIGEVIRTWETTAEYMIDMRDAGRGMIIAQEAFIARSVTPGVILLIDTTNYSQKGQDNNEG